MFALLHQAAINAAIQDKRDDLLMKENAYNSEDADDVYESDEPMDDELRRGQSSHPLIDRIVEKRNKRKQTVDKGVAESTYVMWIKNELQKEQECLELPFTIVLLLSFAILAIVFMGQDTVIIVENAITQDIQENANFAWAHDFGHKSIGDVNSYADFWSWTRLGFVPLVAPSSPWSYSQKLQEAVPQVAGQPAYDVAALPTRRPMPHHSKPVPINNDYLRYNRIIGGFRFRQRVANASASQCKYPGSEAVFGSYIGKPCTMKTDYELDPDRYATESFDGAERVEWLYSDMESHEELIQHIIDMEDGCSSATVQQRECRCVWCRDQNPKHPWLNELTLRIEITFVVYNAQYGLYSKATVNFWFNRAGHIHKMVNIQSAWAGLEVRNLEVLATILLAGLIWIFSCLYVFKSEGKEILDLIRAKNKRWYMTLVDDYIGYWNCVDWLSIFIACMILVLFLVLTMRTMSVNSALGQIAERQWDAQELGIALGEDYKEDIQEFYAKVEAMNDAERSFRFTMCMYPLVLMMRLFKSFAAQPRLAVVTETFVSAKNDLIHFFIVLASVYFCMTVNSVLFFGQDDLNFATLERALHSCFRAMQGDWDWDGMREIGRGKAFAWFFTFIVFMVLILFNMLLAVVLDAYSNVKSQAEGAESLPAQLMTMKRRWQQTKRGERVRLNDIWDALLRDWNMDDEAMEKSTRRLFPDSSSAQHLLQQTPTNDDNLEIGFLTELVPDLQIQQATRTLKNSQLEYVRVHEEPFSEKDLEEPLNNMLRRTSDSVMSAGWLKTKLETYSKLDEDPDQEEDHAAKPDHLKQSSHAKKVMANHAEQMNEGFKRIKETTQHRTAELAEDVASVLGEEMQGLERRQREQQQSMKHTQANLQSLRQMVWKLNETFEEISRLTARISQDDPQPIYTEGDHTSVSVKGVARMGSGGHGGSGMPRMRSNARAASHQTHH